MLWLNYAILQTVEMKHFKFLRQIPIKKKLKKKIYVICARAKKKFNRARKDLTEPENQKKVAIDLLIILNNNIKKNLNNLNFIKKYKSIKIL